MEEKFSELFLSIVEIIFDLYNSLADPVNVQVGDNDVRKKVKRSPNLDLLMGIEKNKAYERVKRTNVVNSEINDLGQFIRLIDYNILELLASLCHSCWFQAEANITQDLSSVFQVEILYDEEGKVVLDPPVNSILENVKIVMDNTKKLLNGLPRLLTSHHSQSLLRGLTIQDGPDFSQLTAHRTDFNDLQNNILETLSKSYEESFKAAQVFADFYPIFLIGQNWNPDCYIIFRNGKPYENNSQHSDTSKWTFNSEKEPVVDFEKLENDIKKFLKDDDRVSTLRQGFVKRAIYVDSRNIRSLLLPIPQNSLKQLQNRLTDLIQNKVTFIQKLFKHYEKKLKTEPQSLAEFIEYCEILKDSQLITPDIQKENDFVVQIYELFDKYNFLHDSNPCTLR